jgi:hypothetical protein
MEQESRKGFIIDDEMRPGIKENLPNGYARIISERCGVSEVHVYRVLNQKYPHDVVGPALVDLAEETKEMRRLARQKAMQLSEDSSGGPIKKSA